MTVCFTGHRPKSMGTSYDGSDPKGKAIIDALQAAIYQAVAIGVREFISGGAVGVDQWAAEKVLAAKVPFPDLRLVIARPFPSQSAAWPERGRQYFDGLLKRADRVVDVSPDPYSASKMIVRDHWMVDQSRFVIAVWNGVMPSGTGATVAYAESQGKSVMRYNPERRLWAWIGEPLFELAGGNWEKVYNQKYE